MMDYQEEAINTLEAVSNRFERYPKNTDISDIEVMIEVNTDLENPEKINKLRNQLIENGYIEIDGDKDDKNSSILQVNFSKLKQDLNYTEPLDLPVEEADMDKIEIARKFAEWLVNEKKNIKTVKLDPARNSKQIWWYDREEKVWNRGGEDKFSEILYEELPEQHSSYLEKETKTKLHRINPITLDKTGTEKGEIPLDNGILQVEEQELRQIQREDYLTSKIPVEYDLEAAAPEKFLEFLEDVTRSQQDMKKIQEFIGYCLMTDTAKYEKALMILGPTDSGKSVFLNVVREFLGSENIAQQSLQDLTNGQKWGLANLVGNIANIDHDLDPEAIEDIGTVKKITSGNPITVEPKWEQPYDYTPTAKHLFSANRTPSRDKEDEAFYNRWLTVVFPESIPREEQNPQLLEELTDKKELKKILNWALAGYHRLEKQGKFTGENGPVATKEIWREWGNSVERFITKFMITERTKRKKMRKDEQYSKEDIQNLESKVHTSTAYQVYQKYAVGLDMEVKSKRAFSSEVKKLKGVKHGNIRIGGKQRKGFKGVELIENANSEVKEQIEDIAEW
jgi:putative DNA primase/helicase